MPQGHFISVLGEWEGYRVKAWERTEATEPGQRARVEPVLERATTTYRCSGCGRETTQIHEVPMRCVRDLPLLGADTSVWVPRYRVACPHWGPKIEAVAWLTPWARVARRLAESIVRLCRVLPLQHVAEYSGLAWDTVKTLDAAALAERLLPVDLSTVETIAMDECAIRRGQGYAPGILEPLRKRVLGVGKGRGREAVRPFFELLGPKGCARVQAAAMDTHATHEEDVRAPCPHAVIVSALVHVVAQ